MSYRSGSWGGDRKLEIIHHYLRPFYGWLIIAGLVGGTMLFVIAIINDISRELAETERADQLDNQLSTDPYAEGNRCYLVNTDALVAIKYNYYNCSITVEKLIDDGWIFMQDTGEVIYLRHE